MNSMLTTIADTVKGAKEQFAHYGEIAIDLVTDNEAWENVTLVDNAVKILRIRDVYRKNKIKRNYSVFVSAIQGMNNGEAETYLKLLMENESLSEETAETIFDVITEAEKPIKAEVLGNLSVALSKNNISLEEYNTLALIIQSCSVAALRAVPEFIKTRNGKTHRSSDGGIDQEGLLISLGIATRHGNMFRLDKRGINLAQYVFKLKLS